MVWGFGEESKLLSILRPPTASIHFRRSLTQAAKSLVLLGKTKMCWLLGGNQGEAPHSGGH
jgi:hypothetical protein